jgi:hypothetical protein
MHARNFARDMVANQVSTFVLLYDISCNACKCMHLHAVCGTTLRQLTRGTHVIQAYSHVLHVDTHVLHVEKSNGI